MDQNYFTSAYLKKERWFSYWHQINTVRNLKNIHSILEVGPGNKIVSDILSKIGHQIKTMDSNPKVNPDFILDIGAKIKSYPNQFDLVLCCEVLEHLPYQNFPTALFNLRKLTKKYLILSLPYTSLGTFKPYLKMRLFPYSPAFEWFKIFNLFPKKINPKSEHCWEIGRFGLSLKKIIRVVENNHFQIIKHYPIPENLYHYLFLCQKNEST